MKVLMKVTAVLLMVMTVVLMPLPAMAAEKKEYISEITTCSAKSYDEAKKQLEKQGFTALPNSNLNSTLDTGVYLGYKTTTDPGEALTDIAAMNMNGGYSTSRYEDILEENRRLIDAHIDDLYYSISGFQTNYKNNSATALNTYAALNSYTTAYEGKDGVLLGDYFLNYDYSDAMRADLVDTVMKGNTQIILDIENMLCAAAETGKETFVERFSELNYDMVEEAYYDDFGNPDAALMAMDADLGGTAEEIYADWEVFRKYLEETERDLVIKNSDGTYAFNEEYVKNNQITSEEGEGAVEKEQKDNINAMSTNSFFTDFTLYCLLDSLTYDDGTMLEYFTRPANDVEIYEVYPVVMAMNMAQRKQVSMVGIRNILIGAFADMQNRKNSEHMIEDDLKKAAAAPLSIYSGVDLSVFEKGVAMTTQAEKHEILSGDNWFSSIINNDAALRDYQIGIAVSSAIAVVAFASGMVLYCVQNNAIDIAAESLKEERDFYNSGVDVYNYFVRSGFKEGAEQQLFSLNLTKMSYDRAKAAYDSAGNTARLFKCLSFVVFIVTFAFDVYCVWQYLTEKDAVEKEIPHHMVTAENEKDRETYILYSVVKDVTGKASDVNNHEADKLKGWLVLYVTKDSKCGSPIEASGFKVQTGSNSVSSGDYGVHLFGENAAINVTAKTYTGYSDKANGTYIFFRRDTGKYTASAFSNGTLAAVGCGGVLVGMLIGVFTAMTITKKKKKTEAADCE